jgi:protein-tyrosine phosphatase
VSSAEVATGWIALDGAVNARSVVPGVLLRSDNLQSLSDRDVQRLVVEEGVESVVDLRTDIEVRLEGAGPMTRVPAVRIEHRSLYPDSGGNTDVELDTLKSWQRAREEEDLDEPPVVRAYLSYLRRRPDSVLGALRTIACADGAVLIHCAAGKDRTGVVVALALEAAGFERSSVVADYLASAERIEAIFKRLVGSPTYRTELEGQDPARLAPMPGTMERFLEIIDTRFGGSAEWLTAHRFDVDELERLTMRLLQGPAPGRSAT